MLNRIFGPPSRLMFAAPHDSIALESIVDHPNVIIAFHASKMSRF